jgi:predicted metalloprotease with PDZ domain
VLVDSPLQMGHLVRYVFEVGGVPHELVVAGPGSDRLPRPQFLDDLSRVVDTFHRLFGALPFERYVFLVTISDAGGGGLEHLNSTSIIVSTDQWQKPDPYARLLSIFAHEYFHLWNVKRLRPHVLGPFDYQAEVYTSLLWALEGLTDYFASWAMAQAGVISAQETLERFGSALAQYELLPGRLVTPVDRASLEAWIRQYRPEANTPNVTVSYYLKGALVGLFLDLELRRHSDNRVTLPRILKELWDAYGEKGYPEQAFEERLAQDGGPGVAQALAGYVHGLEEFDETVLEWVGLRLDRRFKAPPGERPVWTGMKLMERNGALMVQFVERGGPAEAASVSPDDEVIALNGERLRTLKRWEALLCRLESGQEANLITARRARVRFATVVPHPPRPDDYLILPLDNPTSAQRAAFAEWLGCPFPDQPDQG